MEGLNKVRDICHDEAICNGWHDDTLLHINGITIIEADMLEMAYKAQQISLMHSELSECLEGIRRDLQDKKLPHRKAEHVEIVDLLMRALDYCGEFDIDIDEIMSEKIEYNKTREDHKPENRDQVNGKKF